MTNSHTLRQPAHRRPSWATRDKSYEHYMRKGLAVDRSPGTDFGLENFSYDEAHLAQWQMPRDLAARLPQELRDVATDWEYAGAAVCTALDRIAKLDDESIHRGYPEKSFSHLSRRTSNAHSPTLASTGMDSPPASYPVSPTPRSLKSSLLQLEKLTALETLPERPMVDTPPFTPVDSIGSSTPDIGGGSTPYPPPPGPDVVKLTHQLHSFTTGAQSATGASTRSHRDPASNSFSSAVSVTSNASSAHSSGSAFDESAWDVFVNTYKAELLELRSSTLPRLKGCGYAVDKVRVEKSTEQEWTEVIDEFNKWWTSIKPQACEYVEKVRELELPTLELIQMERLSQGMSV